MLLWPGMLMSEHSINGEHSNKKDFGTPPPRGNVDSALRGYTSTTRDHIGSLIKLSYKAYLRLSRNS